MQLVKIFIYTDLKSPRPKIGTGMYLLETDTKKGSATISDFITICAGANTLEATTLLGALQRLNTSCELEIYTGHYVPALIESGQLEKWRNTGWITKRGTEVKDRFVLNLLIEELGKHKYTFHQEKHEYYSWMETEAKRRGTK